MKYYLRTIIRKSWESPTISTWLSYSTKALSLFVVLPLILKKYSVEEVALWYVFAAVISLQGIADMGFRFTFIRFIAYAQGGASDFTTIENSSLNHGNANHELILRVYRLMKRVYFWMALILFLLLITLGTWGVYRSVELTSNNYSSWSAWGIIVFATVIKFYGSIYGNLLEGINKIALVRRWETLTSLGAILTSVIVLIFTKSLFALVLANQIWVVLNVFRNYYLMRHVENARFREIGADVGFDKELFKTIWRPAWKTGVSGIMSNSLGSFMSVLYAQIGDAQSVAAYLLALRLIGVVKDVSVAPYYTKLPSFAMLYSKGKKDELILLAQKGMLRSNFVFVLGAICIGLAAPYLLGVIHSKVPFIDNELWLLLVFAYFLHRYGAMHVHLYGVSNHIIGHIADGVSGLIFVVVSIGLISHIDVYAIPIGLLAGYTGFYAWYAGMHSYRFMKIGIYEFEKKAGLFPLILLIAYALFLEVFSK
jgi:hypothetical protein